MAAVDYFLTLQGIDGETNDEKMKPKKAMDLESWSISESQLGTHSAGSGGGGAGKVSIQDFHFTKKMDKASTPLFAACAEGKHIPKAVLYARKAGGKQEEFFTITLTDVLVSSYHTGGSGHGDIVPTDQCSLNFAKIELEYKPQNADGSLGGGIKNGWDIKKNAKT